MVFSVTMNSIPRAVGCGVGGDGHEGLNEVCIRGRHLWFERTVTEDASLPITDKTSATNYVGPKP